MSQVVRVLAASFAAMLIASCTQNNTTKTEQILAPQAVEKSFKTTSANQIKFQKASFGKAFLMRASYKIMSSTPMWDDLKPVLVVFEKHGDKLGLFEVDTLAAYKVLDSNKLLSTFEISKETDSEVYFDWGTGLKVIFKDTMASPLDNGEADQHRTGESDAFEVVTSIVKVAEFKDNELHVRQSARIRESGIKSKSKFLPVGDPSQATMEKISIIESVVEFDYSIAPYVPNPKFIPKESDELDRVGFFTVNVGKDGYGSEHRNLIMRWDTSEGRGPITFALSKHVPEHLKPTFIEAIQYWNKVLGKDAIRITEGFDPESALPLRTVVIHWLPWVDAGMARATTQADPLTGEILRGQIYMTSFFNKPSTVYADGLAAGLTSLSLPRMTSAKSCVGSLKSKSWKMSGSKASQGFSESKGSREFQGVAGSEKFMKDEIRYALAHEVGHTMGLRHNFAASTQPAMFQSKINEEKTKYETDPSHPGAEVSSSVMDYITDVDSGILGRFIAQKPLKYDVFALSWANSATSEVKTVFKYCSDEHMMKAKLENKVLYGCELHDTVGNPLTVRAEETKRRMHQLVESKFNSILEKLYPAGTSRIADVNAVLTADNNTTGPSFTGIPAGQRFFTTITPLRYLFVESGGPSANSVIHFTEYIGTQWDQDPTEIETALVNDLKVAKPADLIRSMLPLKANGEFDAEFIHRQFEHFVASPRFSKGRTQSGRDYELTDQQKTQIQKYLTGAVGRFNFELGMIIGSNLENYKDREAYTTEGRPYTTTRELRSLPEADQWAPQYIEVLHILMMAKLGDIKIAIKGKDIVLPTTYHPEIRMKLFSAVPRKAQGKAANKLREEVLKELGILYAELKPESAEMNASKTPKEHYDFLTSMTSKDVIPGSAYEWAKERTTMLRELEDIK